MRSRAAIGASFTTAPGLSPVVLGEKAGAEQVTISLNQMPLHSHTAQMRGTASAGNTDSPAGAAPAKLARSNNYSSAGADTNMAASTVTVGTAGGGQPLNIRNPYTGLLFCIASQGIFPSRD
jgi:microcystin-dependent protein